MPAATDGRFVMRSSTAMRVCIAGSAVVGAVYAFSPLTVIFAGLMLLLLKAAVRDLDGPERRRVLGALGVALALRLVVLAAIYVSTDPFREEFTGLFGDGRYTIQRSAWILNDWQGLQIGPFYRLCIFYEYGDVDYDRAFAIVQWFLGPSRYALTLVSVLEFFTAVVLLYRLARRAFGASAAAFGLVVLAFWPTFIVWSVSMLKESALAVSSAIAVAAAVRLVRADRWHRRVLWIAVCATGALLAGALRSGAIVIVAGAIIVGYTVFAFTRRPAIASALLALAVAGGVVAARSPGVQARAQAKMTDAQRVNIGHVRTVGKAYRAADQYFYDIWPAAPTPTFDEGGRYLLRAAAMFLLAPLPLQVVSLAEIEFLPQHFAWYLLVALACAGVVVGLRRDALLTGMCAGYCLAGLCVIAPASGNIGTLVRHRDMIVPFLVWLSGVGATGLLGSPLAKSYVSD